MDKFRGYGLFLFRLLVSTRLVWGVQDNILSWDRMIEFEYFLAAHGTPLPLLGALLSVYTQFFCGVSVLLGLWIRWASIPLIINFLCALFIAHRGDSFVEMHQALTMLTAGFVFLFEGPGKLAIDNKFR